MKIPKLIRSRFINVAKENGKQPMGLSGNLPLEISEIEKSPK